MSSETVDRQKSSFVLLIILFLRLTFAILKLLLRDQYISFVLPRKDIFVSERVKCELSEVVNVLPLQIQYAALASQ